MLSMQYLQIIVTIFVAGEIVYRLSKEIYKTREKQKTREGLIKLNWTIPNVTNEIEDRLFLKKQVLFTFFLDSNFSIIFKWIRDLQTKFSIKKTGDIIATVVLSIILTGILLKNFSS